MAMNFLVMGVFCLPDDSAVEALGAVDERAEGFPVRIGIHIDRRGGVVGQRGRSSKTRLAQHARAGHFSELRHHACCY
jgi:hypothetical protein